MRRQMLRMVIGLGLVGWLGVVAQGQDTSRAASLAERQEAEERYRRLASTVEDLLTTQSVLQKRISALSEELRHLREEILKPNTAYAARDDLRRLAEQVQEMDRKREADKKIILEELQKLAKAPAPQPVVSTHTPSKNAEHPPEKERIEHGYHHVVEKNQNLSLIVQAFRQKGVKVTRKMVEEANPGINPNKLFEGQKLFIPDPAK